MINFAPCFLPFKFNLLMYIIPIYVQSQSAITIQLQSHRSIDLSSSELQELVVIGVLKSGKAEKHLPFNYLPDITDCKSCYELKIDFQERNNLLISCSCAGVEDKTEQQFSELLELPNGRYKFTVKSSTINACKPNPSNIEAEAQKAREAQAALKKEIGKRQELESDYRSLLNRYRNLEGDYSNKVREYENLIRKSEEERKKMQALVNQLEKMEEENKFNITKIEETDKTLGTFKQKNEELERDLKTAQERIRTLEEELMRKGRELESANETIQQQIAPLLNSFEIVFSKNMPSSKSKPEKTSYLNEIKYLIIRNPNPKDNTKFTKAIKTNRIQLIVKVGPNENELHKELIEFNENNECYIKFNINNYGELKNKSNYEIKFELRWLYDKRSCPIASYTYSVDKNKKIKLLGGECKCENECKFE
jgi:hypothetical protein